MSMMSDRDREMLRKHLAGNLDQPVEIVLFTERPSLIYVPGRAECVTCEDTRKLLEDFSSLSDKVRLTVHEMSSSRDQAAGFGIDRVPAFAIKGASRGSVRFFGIPSGYEFSAFVAAVTAASTGTTSLSDDTREFLEGLATEANVKVFTTPGCPYCPAAAKLGIELAVESPFVTCEVFEATEFPDLARKYSVRGVPKVVVNDTVEFVGALPEASFVDYIKRATVIATAPDDDANA